MKPTIYVFLNAFWRHNNSLSGSDVRAVNIFKRLKNDFSKIIFFTDASGQQYIKNKNISHEIIYSAVSFNIFDVPISYILRTFYSLFKLFSLPTPNYFYSTSDFPPDVIPVFLFKRDAQWVQLIHHFYEEPRIRKGNIIVNYLGYYAQQFSHFLIKLRADKIIVVNSFVKDLLISKGFNKNKIFVVPNGVDIKFINSVKKDIKYKFDAVSFGRLSPQKGLEDLIKIWKFVHTIKPNYTLGIIGGGDTVYEDKLKRLVEKLDLSENVIFLGALSNKESFSIIKSSKIFVSTSYEEGWGMAIAEASACGTPSIVWNLTIFNEVFDKAVIKIDLGNTKKFSLEILRLIGDAKSRIALGEYSKKFVGKYDWNNIVSKELAIILGINE